MESISLHDARASNASIGLLTKDSKGVFCSLQNHKTPLLDHHSHTVLEQIKKHESYWVKQLGNSKPTVSLPFNTKENNKNKRKETLKNHTQITYKEFSPNKHTKLELLAAILIYFYKINNYNPYTIAYSNNYLATLHPKLKPVLSEHVPLTIDLNSNINFITAEIKIFEQISELENHKTYVKDITKHYPKLQNKESSLNTLSVNIVKSINDYCPNNPTSIAIVITENSELYIYSNKQYLEKNNLSKTVINNIPNHLKNFLYNTNNDQPIYKIPTLTKEEYKKIVIDWNNTEKDYPINKTLINVFEEQVKKSPNNIAVEFKKRNLTYEELNNKSNQLANYLLENFNIKPDTLIAICIERSLEMIIGILGILKAGAAYLPIDTNYPETRIKHILNDSNASIILTNKETEQSLQLETLSQRKIQTIPINDKLKEIRNTPRTNPLTSITPNNLAYVIYTSGTTGKPKGVLIEHKSAVNMAYYHIDEMKIDEKSIMLQLVSSSFDVMVGELTTTLLSGAKLHVTTKNKLTVGPPLIETINKNKITAGFFPNAILKALPTNNTPSLSTIVSGGEECSQSTVKKWHKKGRIFINAYGPTEATVCSTMSICSPEQKKSSIGKPCANTKAYILDKHLQPTPIGAIGELYIGGIGLARGYLNRPELNQEKFIPNPLDNGKTTIYKSGDLARWLPNGEIDFIGRADDQVKIRGFRIELGEINNWLQKYPAIKQSTVLAKKNEKNQLSIAAYLICKNNFDLAECKNYLKKSLPNYMIPSSFVILDSFPLNSSGKIDKKALVLLKNERTTLFKTAKTEKEKALIKIWAKVLGLTQKEISIEDDFFDIGGDSLTSTQTILQINNHFKTNLNVENLFKYQTIENLAKKIKPTKYKTLSEIIKKAPKQNDYPLSYAQELIWLHQQAAPNVPFYNEAITIEIKNNIKIRALEKSINEIIKRHTAFRTNIVLRDNQPRQVIQNFQPLKIPYFNLTSLDKDKRQKRAQIIATKQLKKVFDLEKDLLLRTTLVKLKNKHYQLHIAAHHVIFDGVSVSKILMEELKTLYDSFSENDSPSLEPFDLQYKDYSVWQKNLDLATTTKQSRKYWKTQLTDLKPLQLPTKQPRTKHISFRGKKQQLVISKEICQKLEQIGQHESSTLFMTLLTAFNTLLYRYTNQDDIAVGTVFSNRNNIAVENMIGNFLNTIILRNKISENIKLKDFLQEIKKKCTEAYSHQNLPFQEVLKEINPPREASSQPFQAAFIFESSTKQADTNWELNQSSLDAGTAKFELLFGLEQKQRGITGFVEYNTDLFDNLFIKNMISHFVTLLENLTDHLNTPINQIPILNKKESDKILTGWNKNKTKYPTEPIHKIFKEQVTKNKNIPAVTFGQKSLTYNELNTKANKLANYLKKIGVTSETLVAVCLNRGLESIVSILGILKAGGAYLPIDPNYPTTRIEAILQDSNSPILITNKNTQSEIKLSKLKTNVKNTVFIDKDWKKIEKESSKNLKNTTKQDDLAYVIYTSGSTGKPKGVLLPHRTITNLINWQSIDDNQKQQNISLFASLGFDVSLQETFYALLNGHTLHVVPKETKKSITKLIKFLHNKKINKLFLPPSVLGLLAYEAISYDHSFPHLNEIIVASEALIINEEIKQFFTKNKNTRLINHYGPSETHVVTSYSLPSDVNKWTPLPSIGKPIANTDIYILDKNLQPVPVGIPGEVYLGGTGLARHYLNRPELNREKFIPSPFNKDKKLYKTGDLAKWLSDGNIAFLDRIDNQVKIRGFRVELDEIDHCLLQHTTVHQGIVIANTDEHGTKKLVAYIVFKDKNKKDINDIKRYLKAKLPDYMTPSAFVVLEKLPLNNNGKVDRKNLPKPSFDDAKNTAKNPPKTPEEKILADIWAKVLKINVNLISTTDNFFELGGHSLSSLQLLTEIKKIFSIDLEPYEIFNTSTILDLISVLDKKKYFTGNESNSLPSNVILLKKGKKNLKPIFFIHPVGGTVFWYKSLVRYLHCDNSIYGIQDPSINTNDNLFNSIEEIAAFYLSQIKKIQAKGPYILGGASFGGTVSLEIAQQLKRLGEKTDQVIMFDSWATYPDGVKERKTFDDGMRKMHENLMEKSTDYKLSNIKSWIDLQWHRAKILWDYRIPNVSEKIILFKAKDPLKFFKFKEDEANYWKDYAKKKVEVHIVPGDHETIFHSPNIEILANKLNQLL